jgi:hypothetical protein
VKPFATFFVRTAASDIEKFAYPLGISRSKRSTLVFQGSYFHNSEFWEQKESTGKWEQLRAPVYFRRQFDLLRIRRRVQWREVGLEKLSQIPF